VRRRKSHKAIELETATNSSGKAGGRTCAGISVRRRGSDARRRIGDRERSDEEEPRSSAPQEMKIVALKWVNAETRNEKIVLRGLLKTALYAMARPVGK
jgi:hypothetical protein